MCTERIVGVHDTLVNQLLTKIDGVDSLDNILLIGMTNRKVLPASNSCCSSVYNGSAGPAIRMSVHVSHWCVYSVQRRHCRRVRPLRTGFADGHL